MLGPVFRTHDPRHDRLVAIKAFTLPISSDQITLLVDQMHQLTRRLVEHPLAVTLVEAGVQDTTPYLAQSYETGQTLDAALRQLAPAPLDRALGLLVPLARAIEHAWRAGCGHGDLHPRDVFLDPSGDSLRVAGFGVRQAFHRAGITTPVRRVYAAPETHAAGWDQRADVYSLGVIAHELLTRRRPAGPGEQDGEFPAEVPASQRVQIRRVLSRALAVQPDDRFDTALDFADALASIGGFSFRAAPDTGAVPKAVVLGASAAVETHPAYRVPGTPEAFPSDEAHTAETTAPESPAVLDVSPVEPGPSPSLTPTPVAGTERHDDLWIAPLPSGPSIHDGRDDLVADEFVPVTIGVQAPPPVRSGRTGFLAAVVLGGVLAGSAFTYLLMRGGRENEHTNTSALEDAAAPAGRPDRSRNLAGDRVDVPAEPTTLEPPTASQAADPTRQSSDGAPGGAPASAAVVKDAVDGAGAPRPGQARGEIAITSEPAGAIVIVDGQLRGSTPLTVRELPLGTRTVQVARPGYAPRVERVLLSAAARQRALSVTLAAGLAEGAAADPASLGSIDVDSRPRGARVLIDGRFVGHSPLRVPEVQPGSHVVIVEMAGRTGSGRRVQVMPGQVARILVDMP